MLVQIVREPDAKDLPLPTHATSGSAGVDLFAAVSEPLTLAPGERASVSAGIRIAVPLGFEAQVRPRSGLARHHGISMVNTPGTIDSDYRGVVHVLLINHGSESFVLNRGERMAQMVITPVVSVDWDEQDVLSETQRGEGGFGHTGL